MTISAALMEKSLAASRFSGVTLEEIITAYFGKPLTVKKEERQQADERKRQFFNEILQEAECEIGKQWLEKLLSEQGDGYLILMKQYKENEKELRDTLMTVLSSIQELSAIKAMEIAAEKEAPKRERELLAVFAARTTGNPHYYDEGTVGDKLLTAFLKEHTDTKPAQNRELTYVERKNRLLYGAGILKDDLSNDTLVYGIHAQSIGGMLHEGIEGFCRMKEPVRLTLLTVGNLQKVWPQDSDSDVYVVENPAVFSMLSQRYPDKSFICGNGQLRLAALILMDMLQENCTFYYAGDFDPEGLLIAQRLKKRYREKLVLWNYREEWYEKYVSSVELSGASLKKLEKIDIPEFQGIKKRMYQMKKAAYQETMMEVLDIGEA